MNYNTESSVIKLYFFCLLSATTISAKHNPCESMNKIQGVASRTSELRKLSLAVLICIKVVVA